jgi:hypothetical protein
VEFCFFFISFIFFLVNIYLFSKGLVVTATAAATATADVIYNLYFFFQMKIIIKNETEKEEC